MQGCDQRRPRRRQARKEFPPYGPRRRDLLPPLPRPDCRQLPLTALPSKQPQIGHTVCYKRS